MLEQTASASRVTQLAVLEEFSVVLVLADRHLISYPLEVIAPPSNFPAPTSDSSRRSPQRLAKDVAFFATARMKDRMLVFYRKKEGKLAAPGYLKVERKNIVGREKWMKLNLCSVFFSPETAAAKEEGGKVWSSRGTWEGGEWCLPLLI